MGFNAEGGSVVSVLNSAGGWRKKSRRRRRRRSVQLKKLGDGINDPAIGKIINNKMRKCIYKLYILSCCVMMMCCFVSSFRP